MSKNRAQNDCQVLNENIGHIPENIDKMIENIDNMLENIENTVKNKTQDNIVNKQST